MGHDMKILSLDVESNGLHGEPFAVGAVVFDAETLTVVDQFAGRAEVNGSVDLFVLKHVLDAVKPLTKYQNARYLRAAFWSWYKAAGFEAVFADVGYPVETRFLSLCQKEMEDFWDGPYPLHEVGTLLLVAGVDPDVNREAYIADFKLEQEFVAHNPLDDALVSAYCVAKALGVVKPGAVKSKKKVSK